MTPSNSVLHSLWLCFSLGSHGACGRVWLYRLHARVPDARLEVDISDSFCNLKACVVFFDEGQLLRKAMCVAALQGELKVVP